MFHALHVAEESDRKAWQQVSINTDEKRTLMKLYLCSTSCSKTFLSSKSMNFVFEREKHKNFALHPSDLGHFSFTLLLNPESKMRRIGLIFQFPMVAGFGVVQMMS